MTGQGILTPTLMVSVLITGDFLGMALTTDRVQHSTRPNVWHLGALTVTGAVMGGAELAFCSALFAFGVCRLELELAAPQTLAFVLTVFAQQAGRQPIRTASAGTCGLRAPASGRWPPQWPMWGSP